MESGCRLTTRSANRPFEPTAQHWYVPRLTPVHVVSAQVRCRCELAHQQLHQGRSVRRGILLRLHVALHNQPADVLRAHQRSGFGGRIRIDGGIEEQHRKALRAPGSEVERLLAGDQNDSVIGGNVGLGVAQDLVDLRQVRSRVERPASAGNAECAGGPSGRSAYESRSSLAV